MTVSIVKHILFSISVHLMSDTLKYLLTDVFSLLSGLSRMSDFGKKGLCGATDVGFSVWIFVRKEILTPFRTELGNNLRKITFGDGKNKVIAHAVSVLVYSAEHKELPIKPNCDKLCSLY